MIYTNYQGYIDKIFLLVEVFERLSSYFHLFLSIYRFLLFYCIFARCIIYKGRSGDMFILLYSLIISELPYVL
ncbi:hypothetical protein HMPREF2531_03467 [Bacteroides intestinalis]|uniref:Uncharacterized protein n=1 Tax=Bacteroides intestinalis TaxID=329854 RepID=A0A139L303_9BACE|nr:hypothetical protein HMPREF2531_03467 [Bacteroides intestinalis]